LVPDLLQVVPELDNAVLNGVRDLKDTSLFLSLITYVLIFAPKKIDGNDEVLGSADDAGNYSSGSIFT